MQKEFWVVADRLPKASPSRFYELLDGTLEEMDFAQGGLGHLGSGVRGCVAGGRPGIDPVVYFKMLMIGFFEGIWRVSGRSPRAARTRCRCGAFSVTGSMKATPDHSSMSVIRQRLGSGCFERVFALVLAALQRHGLLKGRHLGIDSQRDRSQRQPAQLKRTQHRGSLLGLCAAAG